MCNALLTIKAAATAVNSASTSTFMQLVLPFVLQVSSKPASPILSAICYNKYLYVHAQITHATHSFMFSSKCTTDFQL